MLSSPKGIHQPAERVFQPFASFLGNRALRSIVFLRKSEGISSRYKNVASNQARVNSRTRCKGRSVGSCCRVNAG